MHDDALDPSKPFAKFQASHLARIPSKPVANFQAQDVSLAEVGLGRV